MSFDLDTDRRAEAERARNEANAALRRARFLLERCRFLLAVQQLRTAEPGVRTYS